MRHRRRVAMAEVGVRGYKSTVGAQEPRHLVKFVALLVRQVLEEALGRNDIELLVVEGDRFFKDIDLA